MLDIDLFARNLEAQLSGKTTGYQYAIYKDQALQKSGAGGFAVRPSATMTADRRISVGSTSKTITAAAVMRALEIQHSQGKSVTIDSPIAPYLPSDWVPFGPHVSEIKIKDLLRHTSGLVQGVDDFDSIKQVIRKGAATDDWNTRLNSRGSKYCNTNFTLFRIIIPYMLAGRAALEPPGLPDNKALDAEIEDLQAELQTAAPGQKAGIVAQIKALEKQRTSGEDTIELRTAERYVKFVQNEVLAKVGLSGVGLSPHGPGETIYYYNVNDSAKVFKGYPDDTALRGVGAGFWFLSSKEFGRFIAGLRNGKIVSTNSFNSMTTNELGMWLGSGEGGATWNHNGAFTVGDAGPGLRGDWMMFPDGVTAVFYSNSTNWKMVNGQIARNNDKNKTPIEAIPAPQTIMSNAFNAAFALKQV